MTAPPHIHTLTCNLLAERTLAFSSWTPGRTQRATSESFQVGGKGINVSKMLTRLHVPNTALCFLGGAPGAECAAWLRAHRFAYRAFETSVATRSGTVVRDTSRAHAETTFLGPDAAPDAAAIRACADYLDAQPGGQLLAVCGSIPGFAAPAFDPLRSAFERWAARGILVIDTYGPPLAWFAQRPVALIKINADELRSLSPVLGGSSAFPPAPRNWIISDGPRDIRFRDQHGAAGSVTPPTIEEASPTGSGDVLLACFIHALFVQQTTLAQALAYAVPFASANAAHPGVAEFPPLPAERSD